MDQRNQQNFGRPRYTEAELRELFQKISSDDMQTLVESMRNCTQHMAVTRGLPFAAFVVGSFYFARSRLPAAWHFGPKGVPFYALTGIAAFSAGTYIAVNSSCRSKLDPLIASMMQKYPGDGRPKEEARKVDDWRTRDNRSGALLPDLSQPAPTDYSFPLPGSVPSSRPRDEFSSFGAVPSDSAPAAQSDSFSYSIGVSSPLQPDSAAGSRRGAAAPPPWPPYQDEPSYMSGTPLGPPKKASSGDERFS